MGEIADSMIYGECCEMCGVFLPGEAAGYPRYCSLSCAKDRGAGAAQVVGDEEWEDEDEL
jgi:hypothetical protein